MGRQKLDKYGWRRRMRETDEGDRQHGSLLGGAGGKKKHGEKWRDVGGMGGVLTVLD